ncbi:TRAP transporter large permease [Labrenzia sp. 011]|uniref:TRAP transporter large permease n=1 Tax=Labrenzia sp. 011 TaxID=2171494 RepID=UPI000D50EE28|nr:TRAP transporter large permease [Labrenzia sp. 011]PVB62416.1 C4-dicarboxylate ABC transporter permease [Labrenzia sp. 011]
MSDPLIGLAGFAASLFLVALRVPIALAMAATGVIGFGIVNGFSTIGFILAAGPFEAIFPYSLSVVPLFLLMGVFASHSRMSADLFNAANALVGHMRGGLAIAAIGACAGFGAICGSSLATVATMGKVALPEMRKAGYQDQLSAASIAAAGTLGVLIPPSILLVIYGLLTEQSIGKLFSAAILPGVLATVLYALAVTVAVHLKPDLATTVKRKSWAERGPAVRAAWPAGFLFLVVIGGIQFGLFSPTEAAAVGAGGAILIAVIRRTLTRQAASAAMWETVSMTGMIFFIMIGATLFNYFIETTGLPQFLIGAIEGADLSPLTVLLTIMLFYIVLGCFMDALSMILLTVPFIFPVIVAQGFDPIWFGILIVTVAELGLITPPIGMNLFVIKGIAPDVSSTAIMKGMVPFLLADCVRLVILIVFPGIVLWLPALMF